MRNSKWSNDAQYLEYLSAANPKMPAVPYRDFLADLHEQGDTRQIPMDLSQQLQTPYPATTPNCLANFIRICAGDNFTSTANATSQIFYVIRGEGTTNGEFGELSWSAGDVFTVPNASKLTHHAHKDTAFYWVHDEPLLHYLGVAPTKMIFEPTIYRHDKMQKELENVKRNPLAAQRNRNGILLANPICKLTKTLTPTLWALYNYIGPGQVQAAHRHNSIALDFCVRATEGVYTLVAEKVDAQGNLIDPKRVDWNTGSAFVTPPGHWHSHHNESDEDAIVLPVQDAGLVTYQRILNIRFLAGGPDVFNAK